MASVAELTIPVPWGHIAAKSWGLPEKPRVLAIHGLNDNAASFDQLIPLLEQHLCVVCLDLPGHGQSSPLPLGPPPSLLLLVTAVKRTVDYLGWSSFNLLAHSVGSHVAAYFAALFGQSITRVLLIDAFFVHIIPESDFILERCQVMFDKLSNIEMNVPKRKLYTYEDSLKKLCGERQTKLMIQSVRALQKRAFTKTANGFVYNNDQRIKLLTYPLITVDFHFGLIKRLGCQLMLISTSEFEPFLSTPATENSLALLRRKLGSRMSTVRVQGSHDVHMDQPHIIAPIIKQFFKHYQSHL